MSVKQKSFYTFGPTVEDRDTVNNQWIEKTTYLSIGELIWFCYYNNVCRKLMAASKERKLRFLDVGKMSKNHHVVPIFIILFFAIALPTVQSGRPPCNICFVFINVHPVYGAGIRTHDLWNMSLLP